MTTYIEVTYDSTSDLDVAAQWLSEIPDLCAFDFEAAVKFSDADRARFSKELENPNLNFFRQLKLRQMINATALSHPSYVYPTHLSFAHAEDYGRVIIIDTHDMLDLVMNWLTTTTVTQIWHNLSFDAKLIYYYTGKFPLNYEDSQQLAKSVLNHVDTFKAKSGLKDLAGDWYGPWGISVDNFTASQMYEPHVLHYATTDATATWKLYNSIRSYIASTL